MSRVVPFFIILILFQTNLSAQIPGFTQFNDNNGLPSNTVYDINQDDNGFIWIATDYGLSRFDGLSFKNFTIADGLPDNEILRLFKDSKKRIWLTGFNGKLGYIENEKFFNRNNQFFLQGLSFNNFVSEIFEDSKNNIWFLESINNIKKLNPQNQITSYNLENLDLLNTSKKLQLIETINGEIKLLKSITTEDNKNEILSTSLTDLKWNKLNIHLYNQKSISKLRNKKPEAFKNLDSVSMNISKTIFNNFGYDSSTNLLYQTITFDDSFLITNLNNGAVLVNPNDKLQNKKILPLIRTTRSYLDTEKNIWIGSQSNGVFLLPNLHINGIQFKPATKNDLHTVNIYDNKLIIGNELSEIILLDKETLKTIKSYKLNKKPKRIRQLNIYNDTLYILSDYNIFQLNSNLNLKKVKNMFDPDIKKTRIKNFKDFSISEDYIYTANSNGVGKINKNNHSSERLWDKRSTAILEDKNKTLWIGTTAGLYFYKSGLTEKFDLGEQFNNSIIYALENSPIGLLVGSNSYGFGILKKEQFTIISKNDGLLSDYIKSIFIDSKNRIWLSTNFGLNCVELGDNNQIIDIKSYTTSDGLYSNDVRSSYVEENKVYVATSKGLNIINLANELNSILPPIVHINEILLNNKEIEKVNKQQLSHNLNNFQFNFSGISFKSLGNITFKYRLKGLENEWISTKTNTVRYSSLPPNNYIFELKAISKNKLESAPVLFAFTISPPIHQTWWFISLSALLIALFTTYLIYKRNVKLKRKRKTKEQISNLRYQALNAQMNPHFINNLLVNINNLADKGAIKDVRESLDKFAELVNLILDSTKSNLINLSDEIRMAKLYLELQKLRFNKNTTYNIHTEGFSGDDLESILVPPMILQPIIENCFKHGFKNEINTNTITVDFKIKNDEFLICEISDNGIGIQKLLKEIPTSKSEGISFSNINERLCLINESENEEKLIFISNLTDEFDNLVGLKVTLKIPLISF